MVELGQDSTGFAQGYPDLKPGGGRGSAEPVFEQAMGFDEILGVAQSVVSSLDLDEVLQKILRHAMEILACPAGSIALLEDSRRELTLHAHAGLSRKFVTRRAWRLAEGGLTERILDEMEIFVVEDTRQAPFFRNPIALEEGIRSLVALPLRVKEKVVGILYLDDFVPRHFPEDRLQILLVLASFAAMSIGNARLHRRMEQLACTDGLTSLYNYRYFKKSLQEEIDRAERYNRAMSLVLFDIDDFKQVNDTFGHQLGDDVLVVAAEAFRDALRQCDIPCRYGGEEFVAILPEVELRVALIAAERVRRAVTQRTLGCFPSGARKGITLSAGVGSFPRDGNDSDLLLATVDNLLYQAKRRGKDCVYFLESGELKEFSL